MFIKKIYKVTIHVTPNRSHVIVMRLAEFYFFSDTHFINAVLNMGGGLCQKVTTIHCSKNTDQLRPHLTVKPSDFFYET